MGASHEALSHYMKTDEVEEREQNGESEVDWKD